MIVYITYYFYDAQITAGRLRSEGIPVLIHQEPGASAMGIHIGRLGEIKLLVHPEHYDLATELLFPSQPEQLPDDTQRIIFTDDDFPDNED